MRVYCVCLCVCVFLVCVCALHVQVGGCGPKLLQMPYVLLDACVHVCVLYMCVCCICVCAVYVRAVDTPLFMGLLQEDMIGHDSSTECTGCNAAVTTPLCVYLDGVLVVLQQQSCPRLR